MNIIEHKLNLIRQIYELPEESIIDLEKTVLRMRDKKKQASKCSLFGCMKGLVVYIADDFDAPLDDFKDYMR